MVATSPCRGRERRWIGEREEEGLGAARRSSHLVVANRARAGREVDRAKLLRLALVRKVAKRRRRAVDCEPAHLPPTAGANVRPHQKKDM